MLFRRFVLLSLMSLWAAAASKGGESEPSAVDLAAAEAEDSYLLEGSCQPALADGARGGLAVRIDKGNQPSILHLRLEVKKAGVYRLWLRVWSRERLEFATGVNGGELYHAWLEGRGEWTWISPEKTAWELKSGIHQVIVRCAMAEALVDRVLLVKSLSYQPTALGPVAPGVIGGREIYFADNFQREPQENGQWQVERGVWRNTKFFEQTDPKLASNAFIYEGGGAGETPAVSVVGDILWRDYAAEFSAATLGSSGVIGLVFNYLDRQNHYRALFDVDEIRGRVRLLRVEKGQETLLAERQGHLRSRQFYRFRVETCGGELSVRVDGYEILRAQDSTFLTGRFGLLADAGVIHFDDVLVRTLRRVPMNFSQGFEAAGWTAASAFRREEGVIRTQLSAEEEAIPHLRRPYAQMLTGANDWTQYAISAVVEQKPHTVVGLAAAMTEDGSGLVLLSCHRGDAYVYLLKRLGKFPLLLGRCERKAIPGRRRLALSLYYGVLSAAVDGEPLLDAYVGAAAKGMIGLLANASGARFADLQLSFDQKPPPAVAANPVFRDDPYMQGWASPSGEWQVVEDKNLAWCRRDYYGNVSLAYDLETLPAVGGWLDLFVAGDGENPDSGYRLHMKPCEDPAKAGMVEVRLYRAGVEVTAAEWSLRPHDVDIDAGLSGSERHGLPVLARFSLGRWGQSIVVCQGREEILVWRDASPLSGLRCGAALRGLTLNLNRLLVGSDHLFNDTFTAAPVHWRRSQGDWRMKNRFWCAPQWSWYGGRSKECAAVWHKDSFPGDFTFDAYMSMQMDLAQQPHYIRPGFQNITVCGDGVNLDSGYSVVYGAEDGNVSLLLRGSEVVGRNESALAKTSQVRDTWPSMELLHRRWWHWRCEKRANRLRIYLDGQLLFDYTDSSPLTGDRLALWTEHRGIMVSRARISYSLLGPREFPLLSNFDAGLPEAPAASAAALASGVAYAEDFERSRGAWQSTQRENSARLRRTPRPGGGACLQMVNVVSGGDFGVRCVLPTAVDLLRYPWLAFDCRLDPAVRINLYAKVNNEWYSLRLSASGEDIASDLTPDPGSEKVGEGVRFIRSIGDAGIAADGRWHNCALPLGECLRQRASDATAAAPSAFLLSEIFLGLLETVELAQSGFGANRAGSCYEIDNVRIFGAPVPPAPPRLAALGNVSAAGLARIAVPLLPGQPWLEVERLCLAQGERQWRGQELLAALFPRPDKGWVDLDLNRLDVKFEDGEARLRLQNIAWRGETQETEAELAWRYEQEAAWQPPRIFSAHWLGQPQALHEDFFSPRLTSSDATALCAWVPEGSPSGPGSMRCVLLRAGSPGRCVLLPAADLAQYPIFSFWYRAEPGIRLDFSAFLGGQMRGVAFLNRGQGLPSPALGEIAGQDDGRWHQVWFNLGEAFCRGVPFALHAQAQHIALQDFGWPGMADGMSYWVDGVRFHPFLKPDSAGKIRVALTAADMGNIKRFRYCLRPLGAPAPSLSAKDPLAGEAEVAAVADRAEIALAPPSAGAYVLYWAADGRGGWGVAPAELVAIDSEAPAVVSVSPAEGKQDAPLAVQAVLGERGFGIRPGSVRVRVSDQEIIARESGPVRWQPESLTATLLTAEMPRRANRAFADNGEKVEMAIDACDLAGNPVRHAWTWTMDYSQDKTPPPAPLVTWVPHEGYVVQQPDFKGESRLFTASTVEAAVKLVDDEILGRRVMQISPPIHPRSAATLVHAGPMDLRKGLRLRFAWRVSGQFLGDFRFFVAGKPYVLRFLDSENFEAVHFATLPNIQKDGQWHTVEFDVAEALRKALPSDVEPIVSRVELGKNDSHRNHMGWWLRLDSFALFSDEHVLKGVQAAWNRVSDPTGVVYAACVNTSSNTVPSDGYDPERLAFASERFAPASFLHVAARDGAGNVTAVHLPLPPVPPLPDSAAAGLEALAPDPGIWAPGGLQAEYFDNADFTVPKGQRIDETIDFAWGDGAPLPGMAGDTFSARWTGRLQPPANGVYTISTLSDDGVRVFLGGRLLIDNWTDHGEAEDAASIFLEAGKQYEITVLYYENGGGATMRLLWSWPGHEKSVVPKEALYHRQKDNAAQP